MTALIYMETSKQVGRKTRSPQGLRECRRRGKLVCGERSEGVAFEYEVLE